MKRFLVVAAAIQSASASGATLSLRAGSLERDVALPRGAWNLESQAVEATQVMSPAEMEEEEESSQEVLSQPAHGEALAEVLADVALPPAPQIPVVSVAPAAPTKIVGALHDLPPHGKMALLPKEIVVPKKIVEIVKEAPKQVAPKTLEQVSAQASVADKGKETPKAVEPWIPRARDAITTGDLSNLAAKKMAEEAPEPGFFDDVNKVCKPACIGGRGICNDNICFCKTPYTGTACQHEILAGSYRFGPVMTTAIAVASVVMGIFVSQIVFSFIREQMEQRNASLGQETVNKESWTPSESGSKKKRAKP